MPQRSHSRRPGRWPARLFHGYLVALAIAAAVCWIGGALRGWGEAPAEQLGPPVCAGAFVLALREIGRLRARRWERREMARVPAAVHPLWAGDEELRLLVEYPDGSSALVSMPADYRPEDDGGRLLRERLIKPRRD